ncbi:hypothetical protein AB0N99_32765 [Streptomyces sp. NPDC093272]|uniref:hypothetical protein n=1 Tax=Streptomyces sp. NPDC093272 TaxID=3154981 RepID=UPI003440DA83
MATTIQQQRQGRDVASGLRVLLRDTGAATESKWMRGLRQARESNVLFGVALHAAERRTAGLALTPLERDLLEALATVMTDEELDAAGAEYRSAVSDLGSIAVLPEVITSRPVSRGFGVEDLKAHLPAVQEQNAELANCAVVDPTALVLGDPASSPAYDTAVRDTGYGVIMASGMPPAADPHRENPAYNAKFQLESFTCLRAVGDQGGGRDEILWSVGARSDRHVQASYLSQEFGAVKKGETRTFTGDKVVFDDPASEFVATTIMVWEADDSGKSWTRALNQFIGEWLSKPVWTEITMSIVSGIAGGLPSLAMTIVDTAFRIIADLNLLEWIRNDNDLSCQQVFLLDRGALMQMFHHSGADWHFNGDGHHRLRIGYTGERPVFPAGVLELTSLAADGQMWNAPLPMGWESASPAELCSFKDELHCMYIRPGDRAVMWSVLKDGTWSAPRHARSGWKSSFRPALAVHQQRLWALIVADDGNLVQTSLENGAWTATATISSSSIPGKPITVSQAPCLVGDPGTWLLCFTHLGDQAVSFDRRNSQGSQWTTFSVMNWVTDRSPSWAHDSEGTRWVSFRRPGGPMYLGYLRSGAVYTDVSPGPWSADGPTLFVNNGEMWLAWCATDRNVYARKALHGANTVIAEDTLIGQPAVVNHQGTVYAMYRR